ncbi:CDP-alcohol phosphatidyltransferase family protein [uncultured Bacteroides sp.]|uniref:CDP-alcohol phosphatidyltransferase family protein n=1 Tax=uncultured Bacteroides sp. TaxID=162156 RepID=UPI002AA85BED|nr:CDP-alcohol phosphatidyltransferase family protein [uncultured Bacteroides sp.]
MSTNNLKKRPSIESSLKSNDTEEYLDLVFYRPAGYRWALLFNRMRVSPNQVTIFSIFLGVAAGVMFYFDDIWYNMIGMCLLIWANMYDSADGQLARMTGQKSELGRILDGVSGDFWFITIYASICLRMTPDYSWYIWALAALSGYFHSKQAAMADYYRNIHLFFLKGRAGSELDNSKQQRVAFREMPWGGNYVRKTFLWFYQNYTASQEKYSPCFQRFFATLRTKYGEKMPEALREEFRKGSLPLMKYTNILSFNTRVIVLFISLFLDMPWIYFIFELTVLNVLLVYMVVRQESLSSRLYKKIMSKEYE